MLFGKKSSRSTTDTIKIYGFKIDAIGVRDRFFKRYFGYWEFARSVYLEKRTYQGSEFYKIVFHFEGREKPLKVEAGSGIKSAVKIVEILKFAKQMAPQLDIVGYYAKTLIKSVEAYQVYEERETSIRPEAVIAEAELLLNSLVPKKARKKVESLIVAGSSVDEQARSIRLRAHIQEGSEIDAQSDYIDFREKYPNNWEIREVWIAYLLGLDQDEAEDEAKSLIALLPNGYRSTELRISLATYLSRKGQYLDSVQVLDDLLSESEEFQEGERENVEAIREHIERLRSDKAFNRKQTVVRPLIYYAILFGGIALMAGAVIWPAVGASREVYDAFTKLNLLKERGILSVSESFDPNLSSEGIGVSRVFYKFATEARENDSGFWVPNWPTYGRAALLTRDAESILADPTGYKIIFLQENPYINAIHPVTRSSYVAAILLHSNAFVILIGVIGIIVYLWIMHRIKKRKLNEKISAHKGTIRHSNS